MQVIPHHRRDRVDAAGATHNGRARTPSSKLGHRRRHRVAAIPRSDPADGHHPGRENVCYVHLTLVPYIATAGEMKTKPTQHSVKSCAKSASARRCALPRRPAVAGRRPAQDRAVHQRAARSGHPGRRRRFDLQDSAAAARRGPRRHRLQEPGSRHRRRTCRRGSTWSTRSSIRSTRFTSPEVGKYVDLTESYKSLSRR